MPAIKKANTPSFVFVSSDEKVIKKGKPPKPSKQMKDCQAVWADLFYRIGDYAVFLPGRFFSVFKVDVTSVKPDQNKYLCSQTAPILLLTNKDGQITHAMEGKVKIKASMVVRAMYDILRKDAYVSNMVVFKDLNTIMKQLENAEVAILDVEERVGKAKSRVREYQARDAALARRTKKSATESVSTKNAQKNVEKLLPLVTDKEEEKYEILREEYALLTKIGLPKSRMPKQPKEPTGSPN